MINAAFNTSTIILVDYPNLISSLVRLYAADFLPKFDEMFVSDLGLSKKNEGQFIDITGKMIPNGTRVVYIDHHYLDRETILLLKNLGVSLIRSRMHQCTNI